MQGIPFLGNPQNVWKRLLLLISISLGLTLLYSLYTSDIDYLTAMLQFSPGYLLLAMTFAICPWLGHAIRLGIWSRFFNYPLPTRDLFRIAIATDLGSAVTPTAVGGAPIKIGMLMEKGFSAGTAGSMVALASLEDVLFFVLFIPSTFLLTQGWEQNVLFTTGFQWLSQHTELLLLFSVLILFSIVGLRQIWQKKRGGFFSASFSRKKRLVKWRRNFREFRFLFGQVWQKGKIAFLCSMLALCFQWLSRFSILLALMWALGLEVDILSIYLLQWMVFLSMIVVPTPGATGGAEVAFMVVFRSLLPDALIGVLATGWRFLTYYFILLLAIPLLHLIGQNRIVTKT